MSGNSRPRPARCPVEGAQLALDTRQLQQVSGFAHVSGHQHPTVELTPEMQRQLAALHPLFAKYHDQDKALEDGYESWAHASPIECSVAWATTTASMQMTTLAAATAPTRWKGRNIWSTHRKRIDRDGLLRWTTPSLTRSGPDQEPPQFFGIPFTRNDGFGVWMFHIWLFQHNPAGTFANFNPTVPQC